MIRGWTGMRFHLAEVIGVDFDARNLLTDSGSISYDYLVLGAGSITQWAGALPDQLATQLGMTKEEA